MSTEEFEVLETMMFRYPRDWGRRVIKKADGEIMLQTTGNEGQTWEDAPIPGLKFSVPTTKTRSASSNPYAGFRAQELNVSTFARTSEELENAPELKFEEKMQAAIDSGHLLNKTIEVKTNVNNPNAVGEEIERITFLGGMSAYGLMQGQVYVDGNNFLKIAY